MKDTITVPTGIQGLYQTLPARAEPAAPPPALALGEWYRFEDKRYAGPLDEFDNPTPSVMEVHLRKYPVLKLTPKGAWLATCPPFLGTKRFVLREATKRFACPTIEEALESFKARKSKQARIHRKIAADADAAATRAEWMVRRLTPTTN